MYLIDSANFEDIDKLWDAYIFEGVTTNPTLMARENVRYYFKHLNTLAKRIEPKLLYIQIVSETEEEMKKEVASLKRHMNHPFSLKIPATPAGYKLMRSVSGDIPVTATAVTTIHQALMSVKCGAKAVVVYVQRMFKAGLAPITLIEALRQKVDAESLNTTIIAASFDGASLVERALLYGAHKVTVKPKLLEKMFQSSLTDQSVKKFTKDFTGKRNLLKEDDDE